MSTTIATLSKIQVQFDRAALPGSAIKRINALLVGWRGVAEIKISVHGGNTCIDVWEKIGDDEIHSFSYGWFGTEIPMEVDGFLRFWLYKAGTGIGWKQPIDEVLGDLFSLI